ADYVAVCFRFPLGWKLLPIRLPDVPNATSWNVNISTALMKFVLWSGRDSLRYPRKSKTCTNGRIAETRRWRSFTNTSLLTFAEQPSYFPSQKCDPCQRLPPPAQESRCRLAS